MISHAAFVMLALFVLVFSAVAEPSCPLGASRVDSVKFGASGSLLLQRLPLRSRRAGTSRIKALVNTSDHRQHSNVGNSVKQLQRNGDQLADTDQQRDESNRMLDKFNALSARDRLGNPLSKFAQMLSSFGSFQSEPSDNDVELLASFRSSQFASKCQDPDEQGRQLQLALQTFIDAANLTVAYLLSPYIYTADHLLPLLCALPGPIIRITDLPRNDDLELILEIFGIPLESIQERTSEQVQDLVTSGKYLVVACNDDILDWWSHPFGAFLGRMNTYRNTITVSHGIDEDQLWRTISSSKTYHRDNTSGASNNLSGYEEYPYPSLLFSETAARIRPEQYGNAAVTQNSKIDRNKKTVLFLCKETCDRMQSQDARDLSRHFNLVISPHPKYKDDNALRLPKWAEDYVVDAPDEFPLAVPLIGVADVVIGQPSGLMSLATHTPTKKLIVLSLSPPGTDIASFKTPVLNNETAHVLYQRPQNWTSTIYEALADTESNRGREQNRASYFTSWFGCIDGYEDYRLLMLAFDRNFNLDISDLSKKYYQISDANCSIEPRSGVR